jgi:hypothetical protein
MHIQESGEMYLETILILSKERSSVRSVDVGEYMGYSKPSVSRAIGLLKNGGYVNVDDDGYLTLSDFKPGADSFSVGYWFKNGLVAGDPPVVSNKNWRSGGSPGFVLGMTITTVFFNLAAPGHGRFDTGSLLPLDYKEGWVYVICSVDRAANTIGMSLDFEPMVIRALPEGYKGVSFDTDLPVRIGQDGVGDYHCPLSLLIDELFIANRALTDEDVAALKTLYTKE